MLKKLSNLKILESRSCANNKMKGSGRMGSVRDFLGKNNQEQVEL